jgi:hypothetical protein
MKLMLMITIVTASAGIALADPPAATAPLDPVTTWTAALTERPLTLPAGLFEASVESSTLFYPGVPTQTGFDVSAAFGVTDRLTIGIDHVCTSPSDNCSGHAAYSLTRSHGFEVAALVGVETYGSDSDIRWEGRLGAAFKFRSGRFALVVAPQVDILLVPYYGAATDVANVSATLEYQATPTIAPYLRTGVNNILFEGSPLAWSSVPFAAGALINVARNVDVGVELARPFAAGPAATFLAPYPTATAPASSETDVSVFARFRF